MHLSRAHFANPLATLNVAGPDRDHVAFCAAYAMRCQCIKPFRLQYSFVLRFNVKIECGPSFGW